MQNIIFIHIECLNQAIFRQFFCRLTTLQYLKNESLYFENFHVAGTSTAYAYHSINHGSLHLLDGISKYIRTFEKSQSCVGLFRQFQEKFGYDIAFVCARDREQTGNAIYSDLLDVENPAVLNLDDIAKVTSDNPFRAFLIRQKANENNFAAYCYVPHDLFHLPISEISPDDTYLPDVLERRLDKADAMVARIVDDLKAEDLLGNTVIVAYGDHGQSFFNRLFNAPNTTGGLSVDADSSWVPAFIFNSSLGKGNYSGLASMVDLNLTVRNLLFPPENNTVVEHRADNDILKSHDLAREKREYALVQSYYAFQRNDKANRQGKSYAILDGKFRLMVTGPTDDAPGGMELCIDSLSPSNNCNLMDLFVLGDSGEVVDYNLEKLNVQPRWRDFFALTNPGILAFYTERYYHLREKLRTTIREKERLALRYEFTSEENAFPKEPFTRKKGLPTSAPKYKGIRWLKAQNRSIVLFGAGRFGRMIARLLKVHGFDIQCFADNNPALWHTLVEGLKVSALPEAAASFPSSLYIITAGFPEMGKQCQNLGVENHYYSAELFDYPENVRESVNNERG